MHFSQKQIDIISRYLGDVSKILLASVVIGFFIPGSIGPISVPVFLVGSATAVICLILSVKLAQ